MTRPPKRLTAVSKLNLVRVEGSKKRVAMTRPSRSFRLGFCSKRAARSRSRRISSVASWLIDTKCFIILSYSPRCTCRLSLSTAQRYSDYEEALLKVVSSISQGYEAVLLRMRTSGASYHVPVLLFPAPSLTMRSDCKRYARASSVSIFLSVLPNHTPFLPTYELVAYTSKLTTNCKSSQ